MSTSISVRIACGLLAALLTGLLFWEFVIIGGSEFTVLVHRRKDSPVRDPSIVVIGSPTYLRLVGRFSVSLEEAGRRLAAACEKDERFSDAWPLCSLMDGDWYVFPSPVAKEGVNLQGAYVNATTGEVKWVSDFRGFVPYWENWGLFRHSRNEKVTR